VIAVVIKLIESFVLQLRERALRSFTEDGWGTSISVLGPASPTVRADIEALLGIGQGEQNRIVGALAGHDTSQRIHPFVKLFTALLRGNRRIVGDVVGMTHEGVYRRQRIALAERQNQEAVVKVFAAERAMWRQTLYAARSWSGCSLTTTFLRSRAPATTVCAAWRSPGAVCNTS